MTQSRRRSQIAQKHAATNDRTFRTFLLMEQFAAREVGERIAQARIEAGMTQEDLAEVSPFSKRSLQDYEAGVTIPYKHMRHLAKVLRRPVDWFLHGNPQPEDEEQLARLEAEVAALRADVAELLRRGRQEG